MRSRHILLVVVLVALAFGVGRLSAGNPDSPGAPDSEAAKMYTLEDIYSRLDTGAAATKQAFTEPSTAPGTGTMHTLNQIYDLIGLRAPVPKTRLTGCWDADGNSVTCTNTGQDGEHRKGVTWPSPRFTDNSDGTVTDNLTGLIWLKNANCYGQRSWANALSDANTLNSGECGLSDGSSEGDWRLPNVRELHSLVHHGVYGPAVPNTAGTGKWMEGDPFTGVQSYYYCSSSTYAGSTAYAWNVRLNDGPVNYDGKTRVPYYVWPVRGGQ